MAMATSHDQNFKNLILDYPRHALAFFAADEAPGPEDDVHIVPVRQEQLQQRLGQRYRELARPAVALGVSLARNSCGASAWTCRCSSSGPTAVGKRYCS